MSVKMEERTGVIVVGAGPAGSTAARLLAASGVDVVLVEGRRLPREKVCAGVVSLKTIGELGLELEGLIEEFLSGMVFTYDGEQPVRTEGEVYAGTVLREGFDAYLASKAEAAGARLITGEEVLETRQVGSLIQAETPRRIITGDFLVGADGVFSTVARDLGLSGRRPLALAMESRIPITAEEKEKYSRRAVVDYGCIPYGYGWIFPKKREVSAGLGSFAGRRVPVRQFFLRFMTRYFPNLDLERIRIRGYPMPLGGTVRLPYRIGRTLLVGDAAGLTDPFIGEGIYYAVVSGRLAAESLIEARHRPEALGCYELEARDKIESELRAARRFARLFYSSARLFHRYLVPRPAIPRQFTRLVSGEQSFREVIPWLSRYILTRYVPEKVFSGYFFSRQD